MHASSGLNIRNVLMTSHKDGISLILCSILFQRETITKYNSANVSKTIEKLGFRFYLYALHQRYTVLHAVDDLVLFLFQEYSSFQPQGDQSKTKAEKNERTIERFDRTICSLNRIG